MPLFRKPVGRLQTCSAEGEGPLSAASRDHHPSNSAARGSVLRCSWTARGNCSDERAQHGESEYEQPTHSSPTDQSQCRAPEGISFESTRTLLPLMLRDLYYAAIFARRHTFTVLRRMRGTLRNLDASRSPPWRDTSASSHSTAISWHFLSGGAPSWARTLQLARLAVPLKDPIALIRPDLADPLPLDGPSSPVFRPLPSNEQCCPHSCAVATPHAVSSTLCHRPSSIGTSQYLLLLSAGLQAMQPP